MQQTKQELTHNTFGLHYALKWLCCSTKHGEAVALQTLHGGCCFNVLLLVCNDHDDVVIRHAYWYWLLRPRYMA
jgi:hypothetical protein